ncbi:mannose-P-dolichol utilization defect 1 protein-like [Echeneis naucrates]|uniref:mannose-P-dolichol utilization defect 1 protein-like n=1 Tax=Echeneis naucrates TaxID=173247 RepID=UPI001113CCBA|nr:mannose-P-dolichol utilization defect 1 protein-like [Echeneis naucrates]
MATSPVRDFLVSYLMPEKCFDEIFVNFHLHVPCLRFLLNKASGFAIVLDMLMALAAQLLKMLCRGSADGLSLPSALLQLYSFSCPVIYAMANNLPLFAWADRLFTLAQTAAIVFLILHYRAHTLTGVLFLLAYSAVTVLLGSYGATAVITVIQASQLAALIPSKVLQAGTNYFNGHTGQLSTLSVLLTWAGSYGFVWISLQETGTSLATLSHIVSACLSSVLLIQVLCYRSSTGAKEKKE